MTSVSRKMPSSLRQPSLQSFHHHRSVQLCGNTLVLWVLVKYENLKSLTNTFLLNLALSDLIFTFGLPFWAYYYMYGWTLGDPACKAVSFVFYTGYYSSIIFLTVLTVHRYMAVVHPMSVVMSRKSMHCYVTSIVIWIISLCAAIPQAKFNSVVYNPTDAFMDDQNNGNNAVLASVILMVKLIGNYQVHTCKIPFSL